MEDLEFWKMDFDPIVSFLRYVVENDLQILTFLEKPSDTELAAKVDYPVRLG